MTNLKVNQEKGQRVDCNWSRTTPLRCTCVGSMTWKNPLFP